MRGSKHRSYIFLPPSNPNALAVGLSSDDTAIAVSSALFYNLNENELEGVIAHEIGHIAKGHSIKKTQVAMKAMAIAATGEIAGTVIMNSNINLNPWDNGSNDLLSVGLKLFAGVAAVGVGAAIGYKWLTDENLKNEYEADNVGARISKKSWALSGALSKIERLMSTTTKQYKPEVAQLFLISPSYLKIQTHPPTSERIKQLSLLSDKGKPFVSDVSTIFCSTCGDKTDEDGSYCYWCGSLLNV